MQKTSPLAMTGKRCIDQAKIFDIIQKAKNKIFIFEKLITIITYCMLLLTCNMKYFDYSPVLEVHGGHEAVRSDDPLTSHIGMSPTGLLHITQVYLCYVHLIIDLSDQSGTEYNFSFISTLQLHYNVVLYNTDSIITRSPLGSQIFFQYNV